MSEIVFETSDAAAQWVFEPFKSLEAEELAVYGPRSLVAKRDGVSLYGVAFQPHALGLQIHVRGNTDPNVEPTYDRKEFRGRIYEFAFNTLGADTLVGVYPSYRKKIGFIGASSGWSEVDRSPMKGFELITVVLKREDCAFLEENQ